MFTRSFIFLLFFIIGCSALCGLPEYSYASKINIDKINTQDDLARAFLSRMKSLYKDADKFMESQGIKSKTLNLHGLPDGELLLFELLLPPRIKAEGNVIGKVKNKKILLSFRDFIQVLDFPITYDPATKIYTGWFIREKKLFHFNPALSSVSVENQEYRLSKDTLFTDNDIMIPIEDLELWFKIDMDINIGTQQLTLDPAYNLPITEWFERRKERKKRHKLEPPSLPRADDNYDLIDIPHIDVNTRSVLRDRVQQKRTIDHQLNIRTSGEFAYGALNTNISANDKDRITSARVSYLRESADPELLGALKARRLEIGDLSPTRLPLTGTSGAETGIRITNVDPLIRQTLPSTQIQGYIFPGWDVELYRENSLLSFQETGPDGRYSFDNIPLFSERNFFKVIAYGPQGEIREEIVTIPFDRNRTAQKESIYDISITGQKRQFYRKFDIKNEDKNTPHFVGSYEFPIGEKSALQIGMRHRQEKSEQKTYASAALSTSYKGFLVNATIASDEKGELASELVTRRQFGPHSFRNSLNLATDHYNPGQANTTVETLSNSYSLEGPFPYKIGDSARYSTGLNYSKRANGTSSYGGSFNLNTQFQRIGINQTLNYSDTSTNNEGANIVGTSSVSGSFGNNTVRGISSYTFNPERKLDNVAGFWKRRINNEMETQLQIDRSIKDKLMRYSAQLNWRPKYATITPRISYDSTGNMEAMLSTNFGMFFSPKEKNIIFSNNSFTNSGSINAFVFFDKNGDLEFNGDDEPIENAFITAPHNGGRTKTNEKGRAYINNLRPNILTDVFLEQGSLSDPFWIPANKGSSIMPRTGTNISMDFPVHMAGEMDGSVYAQKPGGDKRSLGGITLNLYNKEGHLETTTTTGPDGFYIFSLIPPGEHILLIDANSTPPNILRPAPEVIQIGYEGSIIYGHDISMQEGIKDVPSTILTSLNAYKERHPHINFNKNDPDLVLNLGSYNSNLMMSFSWYRIVKQFSSILEGGELLVPPNKSFASTISGKHTLRVALPTNTIDSAYKKCSVLIENGLFCKVELLPGAIKKKIASKND